MAVKLPNGVERWPVAKLRKYDRNARTHSDEQVAQIVASIEEFGFTNPLLVAEDGEIIAGHGRLMAAEQLGLTEVPVVVLGHLTDAQRRAYVIADNQLALNAGWDEDLLRAELSDLDGMGFDLSLVGFSEDELAGLLEVEQLEPEDHGDADEVPEPPVDPVTKPGDVWLLGKHRVMCGDSTDTVALECLMQNKPADLWLTDPPYNVSYEGKTKDALTIKNDSMKDEEFRKFLRDVYAAANCFLKPGASFYIWHADSEGYNFRGAAHDVGWKVRQCLVWVKSVMVMGRQDY